QLPPLALITGCGTCISNDHGCICNRPGKRRQAAALHAARSRFTCHGWHRIRYLVPYKLGPGRTHNNSVASFAQTEDPYRHAGINAKPPARRGAEPSDDTTSAEPLNKPTTCILAPSS